MKIVIIEDEKLTAKELENVILELLPTANIQAVLHSVSQSEMYFKNNSFPDLILSDIQLGDGLSFEIFENITINVPIIFCTAYDEFMLNAFKNNGIDYLLKPFTKDSVKIALDKYHNLSEVFSNKNQAVDEIRQALKMIKPTKSSNILVYYKDTIIPLKIDDIAVFYIQEQATYLKSFNDETYFIDKTLSQIEEICGENFFRANRQFLINRKAVKNVSHHLSRKFSVRLSIPFEYESQITVSKNKLKEFLEWLSQ